MGMFEPVVVASDRVMATLVAGLEIEFGRGAAEGLAQRFLKAEACEFHWDGRVAERWIGSYEGTGDDDIELDRVAILGRFDGSWFAAICIVDGDGNAHGMMGCSAFSVRREAEEAYARML